MVPISDLPRVVQGPSWMPVRTGCRGARVEEGKSEPRSRGRRARLPEVMRMLGSARTCRPIPWCCSVPALTPRAPTLSLHHKRNGFSSPLRYRASEKENCPPRFAPIWNRLTALKWGGEGRQREPQLPKQLQRGSGVHPDVSAIGWGRGGQARGRRLLDIGAERPAADTHLQFGERSEPQTHNGALSVQEGPVSHGHASPDALPCRLCGGSPLRQLWEV